MFAKRMQSHPNESAINTAPMIVYFRIYQLLKILFNLLFYITLNFLCYCEPTAVKRFGDVIIIEVKLIIIILTWEIDLILCTVAGCSPACYYIMISFMYMLSLCYFAHQTCNTSEIIKLIIIFMPFNDNLDDC